MKILAINYNLNYNYNRSINFGKRSPQDFYEQDFNKKNMPDTMRHYLYADFAQRSRIAPIQIMQETFDNLEAASTVDDIKELFPNEPKFAKLRPANYSGATSGVLKKIKDIKALQEVPEPLFKDGSDDLTTYLVKKIYLEGKTVKEIDKDFARDINPIYELAARIPDEAKKSIGKNESAYFSHSTVYNLGIRFPGVPFWNSFIATRDDYERTNRVRLAGGRFVDADSEEAKAAITARKPAPAPAAPKPRRYKFKRHEIKQITDSIVNSKGDTSKVLKNAARSGRNLEELTFLQQFWSEIMSVATEKIHLSDEMIDFNRNRNVQQTKLAENAVDKLIGGIDFSLKEKTPLQIFWNERPELKGHFSNAIADTVLLFTDYYGADGNNEEFKALLNYAQRLKPDREARKIEHARIQAEYDKLAITPETELPSAKAQIEELKSNLQNIKKQEFVYTINGKEIRTTVDIERQGALNLENDFALLPKPLAKIYKQELNKITQPYKERFWLTTSFVNDPNAPDEIKALIHSEDEINNINKNLIEIIESKHNAELEATRLSLLEYAGNRGLLTPEFISKHTRSDILTIRDAIVADIDESEGLARAYNNINTIYKRITTPLSNKEKKVIRQDLFDYLKNYEIKNSLWPESFIPRLLQIVSNRINDNNGYAQDVKNMLKNDHLFEYEGPVLRQVTSSTTPKAIKTMIRERGVQHILSDFTELIAIITTSNESEFRRLMAPFPNEMNNMILLAKHTIMKYVK